MKRQWSLLSALLLALLLTMTAANLPPYQSVKNLARPLAFNDGRYSDLAIGTKDEAVGSIVGAGSVSVLYGTSNRLAVAGNQYWTQNLIGGADSSEQYDHFGRALAIGDFNGDGWRDLAIGVPYESIGEANYAGAVNILYGSSSGLTTMNNQFWHQGIAGIDGAVEQDDHFGWALAAGDFNGDGFDELAIGVPDEDIGTISNAGAVHVMYGSVNGLIYLNNKLWHQDEETSGDPIQDQAEAEDRFGHALAVGDFNGDGLDDLAIGVPGEDHSILTNVGGVHILFGTQANGLTAWGDQFYTYDTAGIAGQPHGNDAFGSALAVGDFDADGEDDLAVGIPNDTVGSAANAGRVTIMYSASPNIKNRYFDQGPDGDLGGSDEEENDHLGSALAAGDFNGDRNDDLAIGVSNEDWNAMVDCGMVHIAYGSAGTGLRGSGDQFWHQMSTGIGLAEEAGEFFGFALAAGDFNGDGFDDLAIGVPQDNAGDPVVSHSGAVVILYGSINKLSSTGYQHWYQEKDGLEGNLEWDDNFGWALAASRRRLIYIRLPLILR